MLFQRAGVVAQSIIANIQGVLDRRTFRDPTLQIGYIWCGAGLHGFNDQINRRIF